MASLGLVFVIYFASLYGSGVGSETCVYQVKHTRRYSVTYSIQHLTCQQGCCQHGCCGEEGISGSTAGAIAGGVVGGFVFLVLLCVCLCCCCKTKERPSRVVHPKPSTATTPSNCMTHSRMPPAGASAPQAWGSAGGGQLASGPPASQLPTNPLTATGLDALQPPPPYGDVVNSPGNTVFPG